MTIAVIQRPQVVNIVSTSQEITVVQRPQVVNLVSAIPVTQFKPFTFTATQGQTVFQLNFIPSTIVSLYVNGAGQNQSGGDFTVSSNIITLSSGVNLGDTVYGVAQSI